MECFSLGSFATLMCLSFWKLQGLISGIFFPKCMYEWIYYSSRRILVDLDSNKLRLHFLETMSQNVQIWVMLITWSRSKLKFYRMLSLGVICIPCRYLSCKSSGANFFSLCPKTYGWIDCTFMECFFGAIYNTWPIVEKWELQVLISGIFVKKCMDEWAVGSMRMKSVPKTIIEVWVFYSVPISAWTPMHFLMVRDL